MSACPEKSPGTVRSAAPSARERRKLPPLIKARLRPSGESTSPSTLWEGLRISAVMGRGLFSERLLPVDARPVPFLPAEEEDRLRIARPEDCADTLQALQLEHPGGTRSRWHDRSSGRAIPAIAAATHAPSGESAIGPGAKPVPRRTAAEPSVFLRKRTPSSVNTTILPS